MKKCLIVSLVKKVFIVACTILFMSLVNNVVAKAENIQAPTDITIIENEDGDLIISSSDKDYLQALATSEAYLSGTNFYIDNYDGDFEYDGTNVTISNSIILNNRIGNGTYSTYIYNVNGYTYVGDIAFTITHGCKVAPTDITITENEDGDLIISSSDKNYLQALATSEAYLSGTNFYIDNYEGILNMMGQM